MIKKLKVLMRPEHRGQKRPPRLERWTKAPLTSHMLCNIQGETGFYSRSAGKPLEDFSRETPSDLHF